MVKKDILLAAYSLMHTAREMATTYDANRQITKYVHSTSRGHEAIQIATGLQLKPYDFCSPYYRDDAMMLAIGLSPYELMLQLLGKGDDPFSGGRTYYSHPSLKREEFPIIPHQSSATGMQAIPATGMAHAVFYKENQKLNKKNEYPIVICSIGDGAITEGEVAEAFQMAVLGPLPIIYLVQDNDWAISAHSEEMRAMDAYEYAAGFKGMKRTRIDGSDFVESYEGISEAIDFVRKNRKPILIHAKVPLLNHHTSGVRKEWYRSPEDIARAEKSDPIPKLKKLLFE
ncbi:MAG: thiamine pyrophosphate-dependent dehydrogenase E1 component subunit alpha, partial [Bacteroidia bacterium]